MSKPKLWYKPVSMLLKVSAGVLAGMVFSKAWKLITHDDDAPDPTDEERAWLEILAAGAVQGVIVGVVKAALDRGAASGVRRLTGTWPTA
ncbi:MAG: DUF4235 domain-containing protein [Actinocatenispora sp.]